MNDETERLVQFCRKLGASQPQAEVMAAQLLKRAVQLADERGGTRDAALARLLEIVAKGRAGQLPPEFQPPSRIE
jgi:hypothetical protein